jgi:hypothetical protein
MRIAVGRHDHAAVPLAEIAPLKKDAFYGKIPSLVGGAVWVNKVSPSTAFAGNTIRTSEKHGATVVPR